MSKNSIQLQDTLYLGVRFKYPPPLVKYLDLNQGGVFKAFFKNSDYKAHFYYLKK